MKIRLGLLLALSVSMVAAQTPGNTPEAHVALAQAAAGDDFQPLFTFVCTGPGPQAGGQGAQRGRGGGQGAADGAQRGQGAGQARGQAGFARGQGGGGGGQRGTPDRSTWHAEPVKVFDNLYFFGQTEYSVWALTTSDGIIVFDTIFDYSVEDEVDGGMKKLGLDPAKIKYAVVSHPHPDHHGGAKFLQDKYGTRIIMSPADWDVIERINGTKPRRDMEATDGQKLTLGDTTVTLYITPGHTPGTLSSIFPVKDNGVTHTVALWGGTGLNQDKESITKYVDSAERLRTLARQAGADVVLSNHTEFDRSKINLPLLANRAPGSPNPYVVGNQKVQNFLTIAAECATSRVMRLN